MSRSSCNCDAIEGSAAADVRCRAAVRLVLVLAPAVLCDDLALCAISMQLESRHAMPLRNNNFISSLPIAALSVCRIKTDWVCQFAVRTQSVIIDCLIDSCCLLTLLCRWVKTR